MDDGTADFTVVGAGLVGLATAAALLRRRPDAKVTVLEKEAEIALHQSGHNSGVVHSGIYYRPGSLKARFAVRGARALLEYCDERGIPYARLGKVIVATDERDLPRLAELERRARANGVTVARLAPSELREREPHVAARPALHVPGTAVVDYRAVARAYASDLQAAGGSLVLSAAVTSVRRVRSELALGTTAGGEVATRVLVNCAGLQCDRVAALEGTSTPRIVPFRGEYYELAADRSDLVAGLVYPVPDPAFPFLGVHLTRALDGSVHVGPNAVLALAREGYRRRDVEPRAILETAGYVGFWRFASRYAAEGVRELHRSLSRRAFVASLRRLVPAVGEGDIRPAAAGVRAQALGRDGRLVDDFAIAASKRALHLVNAPSPGATASLLIGDELAERALALR